MFFLRRIIYKFIFYLLFFLLSQHKYCFSNDFKELLNELKTNNVEPLTSISETTLKLRSDKVESENIREQIIKNSPQENEDYFVVPKVIE